MAIMPHLDKKPVLPEDMGEMRTIMASDRTLMAWVRTSLSMYSFGFTIYKFLQAAAEQGQITASDSPLEVGLFLVAMGTAAILLGTIGYWVTLRDLERVEEFRLGRPVLLIATIMCMAGVTLFLAMATKIV